MEMKFINREIELNSLEKKWEENKPHFIIGACSILFYRRRKICFDESYPIKMSFSLPYITKFYRLFLLFEKVTPQL